MLRATLLPIYLVRVGGLGARVFCESKMADVKGSALVILAEGAEEMEAVITADVLRRGKVRRSPHTIVKQCC